MPVTFAGYKEVEKKQPPAETELIAQNVINFSGNVDRHYTFGKRTPEKIEDALNSDQAPKVEEKAAVPD